MGVRTLDPFRQFESTFRVAHPLFHIAHNGMRQGEIEPAEDTELLQKTRVELAVERRVVALDGGAQMSERCGIVAAVPRHKPAHRMRGKEGAVGRLSFHDYKDLVGYRIGVGKLAAGPGAQRSVINLPE
jgi:hypothetical protein